MIHPSMATVNEDDDGGGKAKAAAAAGVGDDGAPVVLITGCAKGGIGYEYCVAFSALGCRVIATDIPAHIPDLTSDSTSAAAAVEVLPLDVTSDASVTAAVSQILATHGRIDVLVNNAGIGCTGPLAELGGESVRRAMDVNFHGQLRLIHAVAPHMAARRTGRIANVGSVVGTAATPWAGGYCASKAAVHAATDALRLELAPFGVRVVKVVPGAVRSGLGHANAAQMSAGAGDGGQKNRWGMYGDFAAAIEERATASQGKGTMEAAVFARHVARKVMSARPPREVVYGSMTVLFAVLAAAPVWARDRFFARRFGLNRTV